MKKNFILIASLIIIAVLFTNNLHIKSMEMQAFTDTSSMTDQEFFGIWDSSSGQWITEGKINYRYTNSNDLRTVEEFVKKGDYSSAKEALRKYYINRSAETDPKVFGISDSQADIAAADLIKENIFNAGSNEVYLKTFSMNNTEDAVITVDVTEAVADNKSISFILIARNKEPSLAQFHSKENASYAPVLHITTTDNTMYSITASQDTTVSAGVYSKTNYGKQPYLRVRDSGTPVDDNTARAYIKFDLSSVSGKPTVAVLSLYGKIIPAPDNSTEANEKEIMLFQYNNASWLENTLTFENINTMFYSWQGIDGGNDWNVPAGADEEYINNLTRFNMVPMMIATHNTHPEGLYDYTTLSLILDFIKDKPASYPRRLEAGMRVCDFINVFHYMKNSKYFNSEACSAIIKSIWQHGKYLNEKMSSTSNWGVTETLGLYWIALYFPEFYESSEWEISVGTRCKSLLENLFYEDYSFREASTHYAGVALKDFVNICNWANLQNKPAPKELGSYLRGYAKFFVDSCFPNDYQTMYGDSDYLERRSTIRPIAKLFNDEQLTYYGSTTKLDANGNPLPAPKVESVYYPDGKIAILRIGMTSDSLYMHINNKNYGNHGHPNALGIIAYAYGRSLLVDPGRGDYNDNINGGQWLTRQTEAHNTIEINDTTQKRTYNSDTSYLTVNPGFDLYEGTTTENEGFIHTRYVFFAKPTFWLVSDMVTPSDKNSSNKYEQTWHLLPEANVSLETASKKAKTNFNDTLGSDIHIVPADSEKLTASINDGYYAPKYGVINDAKYISYTQNTYGTVTFDTLLYPTAKGQEADPIVTRLMTEADTQTATALEIKAAQNQPSGYYYLSYEQQPKVRTFGNYTYNGKMAFIQTKNDGTIDRICMAQGSELKEASNTIIKSSVVIDDLQVSWQADGIHIESNYLKNTEEQLEITIYSPNTAAVFVNGQPAAFIQMGNEIHVYINKIGIQYDQQNIMLAAAYTRKTANNAAKPMLYTAFYQTTHGINQLIKVELASPEKELEVGESATLSIQTSIPNGAEFLKILLWNNSTGMNPMADSVLIQLDSVQKAMQP